jgi:diguanylate cyclase (GGDEF)-like protein
MVTNSLAAIAFLAMACAVNDLFAATEGTVLQNRRAALMVALLSGALMETMRIAMAPLGIALFDQLLAFAATLCLLAVPACFWPVLARLKRGRMHVVSQRLLTRALRAEAKAAAAQSWLDMAEQAGHVGHWQITVPDNRLIWSDEVYRIHGLWREHYCPHIESALAVFHPLDGKRIGKLLQETVSQGGGFEATVRLRRPDGEIRHVILRAQARMDGLGAVAALDGVIVDVTEPRRVETARPPAHAGAVEALPEDPLTGLADHKQFDASLGYEFKRAVRSRKPLGLVLLEIDQFSQYAAHHGKRQADVCLRTVAQAVQAVPRRTGDVVARFGKTEIAVLLPLADAAGAERVAAQIADAVRALGLQRRSQAWMICITRWNSRAGPSRRWPMQGCSAATEFAATGRPSSRGR